MFFDKESTTEEDIKKNKFECIERMKYLEDLNYKNELFNKTEMQFFIGKANWELENFKESFDAFRKALSYPVITQAVSRQDI